MDNLLFFFSEKGKFISKRRSHGCHSASHFTLDAIPRSSCDTKAAFGRSHGEGDVKITFLVTLWTHMGHS